MKRLRLACAIAWCGLATPGCEVEQDLGNGDAGAGVELDAGPATGPAMMVGVDGRVVDPRGNPLDAGPSASDIAPVAGSFLCPADQPSVCLSRMPWVERYTGRAPNGPSHITFDAAGNRYTGLSIDGLFSLRASYTPAGHERWSYEGLGDASIEIGGNRACLWTSDVPLDEFVGRELGTDTEFAAGGAIACYDSTGTALWWRALDFGTPSVSVHDYTVDAAGQVYVVGQIWVGASVPMDAFVAQILANGELGWMRVFAGPDEEKATGVTVDALGLRVLGSVHSQIEIGGIIVERDPVNDEDGTWFASLTLTGDAVWAVALHPAESMRDMVWRHALWADGSGGTVLAIQWYDGVQEVAHVDATGAIEIKRLISSQFISAITGLVPFEGGFVLAGTCPDERDVTDGCLVVVDRELQEVSSGRYGRAYAHGDAAKLEALDSIAAAPDGSLYVAGRTSDRRDYEPHDPFIARVEAGAP